MKRAIARGLNTNRTIDRLDYETICNTLGVEEVEDAE